MLKRRHHPAERRSRMSDLLRVVISTKIPSGVPSVEIVNIGHWPRTAWGADRPASVTGVACVLRRVAQCPTSLRQYSLVAIASSGSNPQRPPSVTCSATTTPN